MPTRVLNARVVIGGHASGKAILSRQPFHFTAALTKPVNILPHKRAEVGDRHHDLHGANLKGKVMVIPSCIGSTHTGLVLLDLVSRGTGPVALVVQAADSLLVSGVILSDVWYGKSIPILEYPGADLFDLVATGDRITIDDGRIEVS